MLFRSVLVILLALAGVECDAGPVLDRIKATHQVSCGAAERPGLAEMGEKGWSGLTVDICRAVAAAVLGSPDRAVFSDYETPKQFARVKKGEDDLYFLTGREIHLNGLSGTVLPGPAVFIESHALLVPKSSTAHKLADLAGKRICVMIASAIERSLSDYFTRNHLTWLPISFSEDGEMVDAYQSDHCDALAYEVTQLAELANFRGPHGETNRILEEPVLRFPLVAATGTGDAQWSAIVAWTVATLIAGEQGETPWYDGGAKAMRVTAPELGLDPDWQTRVLATVGHYGTIYDRNLGAHSGMHLARGVNSGLTTDGLLPAPFIE